MDIRLYDIFMEQYDRRRPYPSLMYSSLGGTNKIECGYLPIYEGFLQPLKDEVLDFLEIGIDRGASLRMWRNYFENTTIVGADFNPNTLNNEERIETIFVDQSKREDLKKLQKPWDVIIDDGSHIPEEQQITIAMLFPYVKKYMFIEDLEPPHETEIMLRTFIKTGKIESDVMTPEEKQYLEEHMECKMFMPYLNTLAVLTKK